MTNSGRCAATHTAFPDAVSMYACTIGTAIVSTN